MARTKRTRTKRSTRTEGTAGGFTKDPKYVPGDFPLRTDGLMQPYIVHEAHASADYGVDGRVREARVTIGTVDDGTEGHPNAMLEFNFTRYDYKRDSANVAGIDNYFQHKASMDFEIWADELEPLAYALMEAVKIGKARGTIPATPSTTAPQPGIQE